MNLWPTTGAIFRSTRRHRHAQLRTLQEFMTSRKSMLKGNPHPVRSENEIFLHASAFKATPDPHIVHVKRTLRPSWNNSKAKNRRNGVESGNFRIQSRPRRAVDFWKSTDGDKFGVAQVHGTGDRTRKLRENHCASYVTFPSFARMYRNS
jgi:hypothetical protein